MIVNFELDGRPFIGLNGGPKYRFTEAVSFTINCKTQAEVDKFWNALTEGGEESQCGWLKDRFGLSWQVIPECLGRLMGDPDPKKAGRVMQAMLKMRKMDIAALEGLTALVATHNRSRCWPASAYMRTTRAARLTTSICTCS